MKVLFKSIVVVCSLLGVLLLSTSNLNARGCSANCGFSTCTIECPAPRAYACGCYYGIASCKCEPVGGSGGTRSYNNSHMSHFGTYAQTISQSMVAVHTILTQFNENQTDQQFDATFTAYQAAVEALTQNEKALFTAWLSNL